ncbi:MAG TPA: HAMP domain-containing sensor histidine kinase [Candidatus Limnocylindria bacterium]|nr:HAMP domain-containing sensor histidine kinase [Candidatus Limnocylindria bacterium]
MSTWRHRERAIPTKRPPWWPHGEPFPPKEADWHRVRGRYMARAAMFAFVAFIVFAFVVAAFITLLVSIFTSVFGGGGPAIPVPIALLVLFLVVASAARGFRRFASPLGDLIEAAESVEAGNYGVRVRVRGPRVVRSLGRAFNAMSERLETSEAERKRLLADVTHELRTPLTIMQGNLEAMVDGVYPSDASHLEPILDETRVLSRLVDDLRTLSLAEAGALALHREPTDLSQLIGDAVASFRAQAAGAGVDLVSEVEDALPQGDVDPVRLREVLSNLLSNALRYTPRGGSVRVGAAALDGQLRVSVRDSGPGIAADALPHVFDRFYKSEESRGAGLGLAIAKSLVVAHGGEITAESAPGQGTEMRFTLPVEG